MLSAIFTTALNDQVTFLHPCKGIKTPTVPTKPLTIITLDNLYTALPDSAMQLLIEIGIETGFRWGELAELRRKDLDIGTRTFTVSSSVVQVNPNFHPLAIAF